MRYIRCAGWEEGIAALTERLAAELQTGKRVLWLTSGGSNIEASVQIMNNLPDNLTSNLSVMPVDERFGAPGHADSNWQQLITAGFAAKQATLQPVLQPGQNFSQAAEYYTRLVKSAFTADVIIAQLGIGDDGHLAGILPRSAATTESQDVSAYEAPPFRRLTLTCAALQKVTAAYAFAFGDNKQAALQQLRAEDLSPVEQPAQTLKQLPEAYLYSDQLGQTA